MITKKPSTEDLPVLKGLWKEAFGDEDDVIEDFFTKGFSKEKALCIFENSEPISVVYWFDCECYDKKTAYVYGVATRKSHRGKGLGTTLMKSVHESLKSSGYFGVILVPEKPTLFDFYKRIGYKNCAYVYESIFKASDDKEKFKIVNADEYFLERQKYLEDGGITLSDDAFGFLDSLVYFYVGDDFVAAIKNDTDDLFCVEFLGNREKIKGFINSTGYAEGVFRLKGNDKPFAMFLPLEENVSEPQYLGFAFD